MVKRGLVLGGVIAMIFGVATCNNIYADNNVDFSITVQDASIQLTVPTSANLDLTPTSANADFKSTLLTIGVGTNNMAGYTLTMSVPSTDISRVGAASGDPVIGTLGDQAGGYSQNDFTANKWGYKITGDNYFPIATTIAPEQWVTDGPANNVDNYITLASKVNTLIPAGTYSTTLTFTAVANQIDTSTFKVIYNSNGGEGAMQYTSIDYGLSASLSTNTFTRTGYTFDGWASTAAGGAPYFADGVTYTAPADSTGGTYKVLYAMWRKDSDDPEHPVPTPVDPCSSNPDCNPQSGTTLQRAYEIAYTAAHKGMYEEDTPGSNTYHYVDSWNGEQYQGGGRDVRFLIQDMTPEICASATVINSEALVLDIRDQKSYWIAKLADGKCWMTQNLDLNLDSTKTYTHNDTDLGWGSDTTTTSWTPTRSTIPTSNISSSGSISGWTNSDTDPYSVDTGNWYWTDTWYTSTTNNYLNGNAGDKFSQTPYPGNGLHGHVGNYYNWTAAIASNDSSSYASSTYEDTSNNPQNSICPAGWRLPTIYNSVTDSKNEFRYLLDQYNAYVTSGSERDRTLAANPLWFVRGGRVYSGSLDYSGFNGFYWSSTVYSSNYAYRLYFNSGNVTPANYDGRYYGWSVRCVAR